MSIPDDRGNGIPGVSMKGKTALITGCARRIGRACALHLAREGADILVHYNTSAPEAGELASSIKKMGQRAWIIQQDLKDPQSAPDLLAKALAICPDIDYLINSASIYLESGYKHIQLQDFDENIHLNALSPFFLSRAFAENSNSSECIVNFLDTRIMDNDSLHLAYHISKRILFSLTRILSRELAPQIRVNAIAPGLILPPPGEDDPEEAEQYLQDRIHANPLEKTGSLDQISDSLLFLLKNTFITGQVLFVDGGRHLKGSFYGE